MAEAMVRPVVLSSPEQSVAVRSPHNP